MKSRLDVEDTILNYDREFPQQRFPSAGLQAAFKSSTGRLPGTVPWPNASKPIVVPLDSLSSETEDLRKFRDYEAGIVTSTAATSELWLKGLEDENCRLKKLLAEAILDNAALKDLLGKNG